MSQPPYPPSYPQEPHSGQPGSGAQGYPPPPPPDAVPQYGAPQPQYGAPQYGAPQPQYGAPQPEYGAPQYGAPQPQYGAPQYGAPQPQYGAPQPQYGAPQYGGPPPLPKKSSALKIVLIVVGVIVVLCLAGGGFAFFLAKDKVEQVVDAASITVSAPTTLGGREKITDPSLAGTVSSLDSEMKNVPGATGSVGAVYGDLQKQDVIMVAAASSINGSAQSRYDEFTAGLAAGKMEINNLADVEPGPLGGIAKCGDTDSSGVPMAVCVWSDNGSTGMFAMMFKKKADLEKEFVALRGEVEHKS